MKARSKVFAGVLVAVTSFGLVACGSTGSSDNKTGTSNTPEQLVWSGWSGNENSTKPSIQQMIDSWNKDHPKQTVSWQGWPYDQTEQQLIIRSQGGQNLDVAQIDMNWLHTLAETGNLVDLSTVYDKQWLQDNLDSNQLKLGQVDGKQYGIPWSMASIGMVYNPTLLQQIGVSQPPTTTANFEKDLELLKAKDKNVIPYAMSTKGTAELSSDFQVWLWTFGGHIFDSNGNLTLNDANGVKALTYLKELKDKGLIQMDMSRFDARQIFAKDQIGFYNDAIMANSILQSNGVAADQVSKHIQPMPMPVVQEGDHPQSLAWGHMLVVFKTSKDTKTAAEFVKHILSPDEETKYFHDAAMPPVEKSVVNSDVVKNDPWTKAWIAGAAYANGNELSSYTQQSQLADIIGGAVQKALLGQESPQQALDGAAAQIKSTLGK